MQSVIRAATREECESKISR